MMPSGFNAFEMIMRRSSRNVAIGNKIYWCEINKPVKIIGHNGELKFEAMKQQIIDQCSSIEDHVDWKKYAF